MMRRCLAAALLALLAACSKPADETAPTAAPAATSAAAPAAPSGESSAAASTPAASEAAPAATGPSGASGLAGLHEGDDYEEIVGGKTLDPAVPGKVEVVEMFNYACPACNSFNPQFQAWVKTLPATVHVVYAPLDFRADFVPYARAYYAAAALGLAEKSHDAVYKAVHETHELPGEGRPADEDKIAAFYAQYGARPDEFRALMDSFAVTMKIGAARQFAMESKVHSTPSLVIDGRYLVKGRDWDQMIENAGRIVAARAAATR